MSLFKLTRMFVRPCCVRLRRIGIFRDDCCQNVFLWRYVGRTGDNASNLFRAHANRVVVSTMDRFFDEHTWRRPFWAGIGNLAGTRRSIYSFSPAHVL